MRTKPSLTRDFVLLEQMDAQGRSTGMLINGKRYDDPVTESVKLGSQWKSGASSTPRMTLIRCTCTWCNFRFSSGRALILGLFRAVSCNSSAIRARPPPTKPGRKDTAVVNPRDVLTILVRFEGYTGKYVFHCHMLEHEDNDMMRPYEVVS